MASALQRVRDKGQVSHFRRVFTPMTRPCHLGSGGTGAAFSLLPPENATGNWVKVVQRFMTLNSGTVPSLVGSGLQTNTFLQLLYGEVQRQALLMAFIDDFRLIAFIFFLLIPLVFLIRRPQILGVSAAAH